MPQGHAGRERLNDKGNRGWEGLVLASTLERRPRRGWGGVLLSIPLASVAEGDLHPRLQRPPDS